MVGGASLSPPVYLRHTLQFDSTGRHAVESPIGSKTSRLEHVGEFAAGWHDTAHVARPA
jgi:hypothetical protein